MNKIENKIMRRRLVGSYLSAVVSISLVLLLVGVASLLLINARNVTSYFKENMKISVIFRQDVKEKDAMAFCDKLSKDERVKEAQFVSRQQGIEEMSEVLGEDFLSVFETAPVPCSINLSLKADYVTEESMEGIIAELGKNRLVQESVWQKSLIEALNSNLKTISLTLSIFIALLLFISFILIGNTVRLNIYNKRFSIHTMRLVGATKAFICKPFLEESVVLGVISALISIIMLLGVLIAIKREFIQLFTIFRLKQLLMVMGTVVASGIVICMASTLVIVNKLIGMKKEALYL